MSRLAQAVARQVEELRGKTKRERRRPVVDGPEDAPKGAETNDATTNDEQTTTTVTEDVTERLSAGSPNNEPVADQNVEQTGASTTMAKKTTAKKAKAAKGGARKAAKKTGPAKNGAGSKPYQGIPDPSEMRLSRGGIVADGDSAAGIVFTFSNGYTTTITASDGKTRDNLLTWLRKRLGADRE